MNTNKITNAVGRMRILLEIVFSERADGRVDTVWFICQNIILKQKMRTFVSAANPLNNLSRTQNRILRQVL